jgi:transcriptional regulator with XRE-family HTH domain
MAPKERLAMRLKRLREDKGISQTALAEKAGISRGYLARLEAAQQDPTLTVIEKLAKALKVSIAELVK